MQYNHSRLSFLKLTNVMHNEYTITIFIVCCEACYLLLGVFSLLSINESLFVLLSKFPCSPLTTNVSRQVQFYGQTCIDEKTTINVHDFRISCHFIHSSKATKQPKTYLVVRWLWQPRRTNNFTFTYKKPNLLWCRYVDFYFYVSTLSNEYELGTYTMDLLSCLLHLKYH